MQFRRAVVPIVALLMAATTAPAVASEKQSERRGPATVTFATTGDGHGRGLSQYGARNRANGGQSWKTIVRHYYPGTSWGRVGGKLRIQITADTSRDVVVRPGSGLKAHSLGAHRTWRLPAKVKGKQVRSWKIQPGRNRSKLMFKTGSWHLWRTAKGDAEFSAGGRPIVLVTPSGRSAYRGTLRSVSVNASGSNRDTVNVVPFESYLRGVVAQEVPAEWPRHAVRAQAVAARTYAAYERRAHRNAAYDLCDTSHCQVYGGADAEHRLSDAAVRATARTVVTYGGKPAFAQFSASNGGWSADGGFPYLPAAEDPYDQGLPTDPATTTVSAADLTRNWDGIGDLVSIEVTGRSGGRVTEVTVVGTNFTVRPSGEDLKDWFDLKSTVFQIT